MQARKYSIKSTPTKSKKDKSHKLEKVLNISSIISVKISHIQGILSLQMSQVLLFAVITLQSKILSNTPQTLLQGSALNFLGIHSFPNPTTELSELGYHRIAFSFFGIPSKEGFW